MGYTSGTKVGTEWHSGATGSPIYLGDRTAGSPAIRRTGALIDFMLGDLSAFTVIRAGELRAGAAASGVSAGQISYGGTTATTVGAAGAASALPATPTGYIIINVAGTQKKVPYYDN